MPDHAHHSRHRTTGHGLTGKTRYVAEQAPRAAERVGAGAVVITSLTNAAAAEIGSRVDGLPDGNIGTLHSICLRIGPHKGKPVADGPTQVKRFNRRTGYDVHALRGNDPYDTPVAVREHDLLSELALARSAMVPREQWSPDLQDFAHEWEAFKSENDAIDYLDMIEGAPPEPPGKIMFVDEAQDLSALEVDLLHRWEDRLEHLVLVGDPDQALYTWRGADPEQVFGHYDNRIVLSCSYRVPRQIQQAANRLIERLHEPERWEPTGEEGAVVDRHFPVDGVSRIVRPVLHEVLHERAQGMTTMLMATCSYMLDPFMKVLREDGVPYHNPFAPGVAHFNPLSQDPAKLVALFQRGGTLSYGEVHTLTWQLSDGYFREGGYDWLRSKAQDKDEEGRPADWAALEEAMVPDLVRVLRTGDGRAWAGMFPGGEVTWKSLDYPLRAMHEYRHGTLPSVLIGTIHSFKGAQADSVHVLGEIPPVQLRNHGGAIERLRHSPEHVRQFYVAMTRAEHKLTCWSTWKNSADFGRHHY